MDRPINASTSEQRLVGGIDNGIHLQPRNVAANYANPAGNARCCHVHSSVLILNIVLTGIFFKSAVHAIEQLSESRQPVGLAAVEHFTCRRVHIMLKKLFVIGIVGLVGAYIVTETKAGSRFRDWVSRQCSKLEKKTTPDEELNRIKKEVKLLDGDIEKVKGDLAEANVTVRDLRTDVERLRSEHKEADALARKHGDVMKAASNSDRIQWGGTNLAFADAKEKWAREVGSANRIKQQLAAAETSLANQEKTRDLIEQQFHEMRRQKDELTQAVADMEAELKLAKIEQMRSKYQNDGTRMAEIKTSLAELRKRINVQREKLVIDARLHRNPVEDRSVDEIFADLDGKPIKRQPIDDEVKIVNRP
jgi:hypothetical protein